MQRIKNMIKHGNKIKGWSSLHGSKEYACIESLIWSIVWLWSNNQDLPKNIWKSFNLITE